ncbi:MAG: CCA tRNA nucleotidyltransferase [Nitrospinae bacterium]|nr:CCA tRNA nucleotidyltransferase [Nitrospinota bacterium]
MDSLTQSTLQSLLNFSISKNQILFVVGGTLRDFLSQKPCSDFDLTGKDASETGISFSRSQNFKYILLDKTPGRRTVRVIVNKEHHLDFTDLQGGNIEEDLSQRDFTINAMGQQLSDFLSGEKNIIDLHKGQEDLTNKRIRVLKGPVIQSDPLRMLRAFRFAATLNFAIDEATLSAITLYKDKLKESAPERIWHELTLFLKETDTFTLIRSMHSCGLLDCLLTTSDNALVHYEKIESLLNHPGAIFPEYMGEFGAKSFLDKHYLLKLSVLMNRHPGSYAFNFSNVELKFLEKVAKITCCLAEMHTEDNFGLSETYELVNQANEELLPSITIFTSSLDAADADRGVIFCNHLLKFYCGEYLSVVNNNPLLDGEDIIQHFGLSPSKLFGKILGDVQKAHVLGQIKTRDDAIDLAEKIIQSQTKESSG